MSVNAYAYCVFHNSILLKFYSDEKKWMPIRCKIPKGSSVDKDIISQFQRETGFGGHLLPTLISSLDNNEQYLYYKITIDEEKRFSQINLHYILCPLSPDVVDYVEPRKDLKWFSVSDFYIESVPQFFAALCHEILSKYNIYPRQEPKVITKSESILVDDLSNKCGTIMIIGAPDSGKSTLTNILVHQAVLKNRKVGWIDADLGQATLGPPSSMWAAIAIQGWSCLVGGGFIGSFLPAEKEVCIASSMRCLQELLINMGVDLIIVDVGGFVFGERANKLHKYQIQLVSPNWILVLERDNQLSMLINALDIKDCPNLIMASPLSNRKKRYIKERRSNHYDNLSKYFLKSEIIKVKVDILDFWVDGKLIQSEKIKDYCGHIVGFDGSNIPVLAWLVSVNEENGYVEIELPSHYLQLPIGRAIIGSLFKSESGELKHDPDLFDLSELLAHFPEVDE